MNTGTTIKLFLLILLVFVGYLFFHNRQPVEIDPLTTITEDNATPYHARTMSYTFTVTNTSANPQKNVEVLFYGPNKETGTQRCNTITSSHVFSIEFDSLNNQILRFMFKEIPPYGTKILNISAQLDVMRLPKKSPLNNPDQFLSGGAFVETSAQELITLSHRFSGGTPDEIARKIIARKIFTWVTGSIKKSPYSAKERGALYTLRKKRGDCTEFMHLFIALCRLNNIPARGVSGFIVTQDKRVQPNDYHDWAEVYVNGSWRLADPFNRVFMKKQDEYIVMRLHNSSGGKFDFHRWKSDNDNLQIAMIH